MIIFATGIPKGQPRVRAFVRGRRAGVYDPGTADDWKASIAIAAKQELRDESEFPVFKGAVEVSCEFVFPRPKSHFRSNGELKPNMPVYHASKPDRDNLDKAVLDVLTSLQVFRDDSCVADGTVSKRYAAKGEACGVLITISPLG